MLIRRITSAWAVAFAILFVAVPAFGQNAPPGTVVGVSTSIFFDDTDLNQREQAAILEEENTQAYSSDGFLTGSIWFLYPLGNNIRVGSTLEWYGTWTGVEENEEEDNNDEEPETYEFGRLLEFYGRFEYNVPVGDRYDLYFGAVFGVPILFPDGDFQAEIEAEQDAGLNVVDLPRVGFLVGPTVGASWQYTDYLAIRSDVMFKYQRMFLFRTSQTVEGVGFQKNWDTSSFRWHLNIGIEVAL